MKNDLIRRSDLLAKKFVILGHLDQESPCPTKVVAIPVDVIERAPAVDAVEVRHGRWTPFYESEVSGWNPEFAGYDPISGYKCSKCGEEAILNCNDKFVLSNYCPNCGADMRD